MMGSLAGPKVRREPAGEAKPDVCVICDGEAGAYCTVGLVHFSPDHNCMRVNVTEWSCTLQSTSSVEVGPQLI